jgi:lipid A 4'-phosphatase
MINFPASKNKILFFRLIFFTIITSIIFYLYPRLDILVSRIFFSLPDGFLASHNILIAKIHQLIPWLGIAMFVVSVAALVLDRFKLIRVRKIMRLNITCFSLVLFFGLLIVINGVIKEYSGRARPYQIVEFGGSLKFTPPLKFSDQCHSNCSFVSGHAATGFALLSLGLFGSSTYRRKLWYFGICSGTVLGLIRIAQGGHFLSDIVYSFIVITMTSVLLSAFMRIRIHKS